MARQWVIKELYFEVQQCFLGICTRNPEIAKAAPDQLWNLAKSVVEWKHKSDWAVFQQKYQLGVFK